MAGDALERALRKALAEIEPRDRLLLQQHLVDGLTIDALSHVYRTHRATAARRIARARGALLDATRRELRLSLEMCRGEIDSLIDFAKSRIHLSLRSFAAPGEG